MPNVHLKQFSHRKKVVFLHPGVLERSYLWDFPPNILGFLSKYINKSRILHVTGCGRTDFVVRFSYPHSRAGQLGKWPASIWVSQHPRLLRWLKIITCNFLGWSCHYHRGAGCQEYLYPQVCIWGVELDTEKLCFLIFLKWALTESATLA